MPELKLYTSQGERFDSDSTEVSPRIESFFFGGVRVFLDVGSTSELIVFFRARKSKSGRAEQFYAVYRTRELRDLFERFKRDLQRTVDQAGLTLQTTSDDVEVFTKLGSGQKPVPGSSADHRAISTLLNNGHHLEFGVGTADDALGLFHKYIQGNASTIAIGENTAIDELDSCDLAIEIGDYSELEPLRETEELMNEQKRTRDRSGAGSSRPKASRGGNSNGNGKRRTVLLAAGGVGALVGLVVLGIVALNLAIVAGFLSSGPGAIVFVDSGSEDVDTGPEQPLQDVVIIGSENTSLTVEDGEFVEDNVTVAPNDSGNISVTGASNQASWMIEIAGVGSNTGSVSSGTFGLRNIPISEGQYELTIEVGEDIDSDDWPEENASVDMIVEDQADENGDDTADENGDDTADDEIGDEGTS